MLFPLSVPLINMASLPRLGHSSLNKLAIYFHGVLGTVNDKLLIVLLVNKQNNTLPCLFNNSTSISDSPFDLIRSNIGTLSVPTMNGSQYFVIFVVDYSMFTWIFLMKNFQDYSQIYIDFATMVKTSI